MLAESQMMREPFEEKMARLTAMLYKQFAEAETLDVAIRKNLASLGFGGE